MPQCNNTPCPNPATLHCSGCSNAPSYDHPKKAIYYCSKACQSAHWPKHQFHCKVRGLRKKLLRVATLLQALVEAYKASVLSFEMRHVKIRDGNEEVETCDGMSGDGAKVEDFSVSKPHISSKATRLQIPIKRRHELLMITLKSGENWVIDFDNKILTPLAAYIRENQCRNIESRVLNFDSASPDEAGDDTDATSSTNEAEMKIESTPRHGPQDWFAQYIKLRIEGNRTFRKKLIASS
ncbi:hypothetical protein FKW77_006887 [Venturia effusa]|uniref:MYND-type domain-containing protein n=1 Tax=Venturia effusa TaxID=50376 RepID=A0A517LJ58_9PEZI|nr:hypothetical protein FKW77_006887 [Venturia effusa]